MQFHPVTSSHVHGIAHVDGHLYVKYDTGKVFRYADVPPELFANLKQAASIGKFLHAHVRGRFRHEEIR